MSQTRHGKDKVEARDYDDGDKEDGDSYLDDANSSVNDRIWDLFAMNGRDDILQARDKYMAL